LLYRYACCFEPLLHELFAGRCQAPAREDNLLHVLQKAYTGSRYTNEYVVKRKQLELMKEKIELLLQRAGLVNTVEN